MPLLITGMVILGFFIFQNGTCTPVAMQALEAPTPITIPSAPASATLKFANASSKFTQGQGSWVKAIGGRAPYTYYLLSGGGTLTPDGWYVANTSVGSTVEVMVQDANGSTAQHTITVSARACQTIQSACGFDYQGFYQNLDPRFENLHCRITYTPPNANTPAKVVEYYAACGTCMQGALGGPYDGTHVDLESPLAIVTTLNRGEQKTCFGNYSYGTSSGAHSYRVETLSDSTCERKDEHFVFTDCRAI